MKVQHAVADMAGFKNWDELIHASEARQELGRLLLEYREELLYGEDWKMTAGDYFDWMRVNGKKQQQRKPGTED